MERLDHLEHLDRHLVDELAQVARETVRDELRRQTRRQRRTAVLYAASGTVALYAGAALALALGLAFAVVVPDWAAALITGAILGVVAYVLRGAARPSVSSAAARPTPEREAEITAARAAPGGIPYPPTAPPGGAPGVAGTAGAPGAPAPRPDDIGPDQPHHRA
ncbi:phage holin family protein [Streptomyces sp. TRM68367]|uniref:phage holin family protein n=1 Tax=Streptomyces sp. TRM68367 TaxID=2758415 RepID=UPI00165BAB56|nr:phage holin family protein [Streptomyces sp. TRM68367]MBC9728676.1 phage holin family protein [Streptomyces sp. TRM68367]